MFSRGKRSKNGFEALEVELAETAVRFQRRQEPQALVGAAVAQVHVVIEKARCTGSRSTAMIRASGTSSAIRPAVRGYSK